MPAPSASSVSAGSPVTGRLGSLDWAGAAASSPEPSVGAVSAGCSSGLRGRLRLRRGLLFLLLLVLARKRIGILLVARALGERRPRNGQCGQQHEDQQGLWSGAHGGYW